MAASQKNPKMIYQLQQSQASVPWCHEFEKMISGMNFHAPNAPIMLDHKFKVIKALHSFNNPDIIACSTFQSLKQQRMKIAAQILGRLGTGTNIETPFFCVWGCNIFIGNNVYINRDVSIHDNVPVHIGNNVLIGPGACICTATHDTDMVVRRESGGSHALPIVVEDDCWIGANVTVLPGVRIGRGAVVAAGAVVVKDVEEGFLVGGVPAKVLKRLR
ncbi:trimeric LpxA-like protein [Mollisia scopiformis]|uniref:Trimeric LpxA-like protein n=1 Tax=Mollisia scopiformis TaxID=149040 RepID=A0A194XPQ3_MOLSC|nr:trimeric LpxA-like protein [Mollisia scopiformis]KUJ21722.1 trimeric LpxA-like protein [Mollisia scopiformis]